MGFLIFKVHPPSDLFHVKYDCKLFPISRQSSYQRNGKRERSERYWEIKQLKLWHTVWYLIGFKYNKIEITANWWHSFLLLLLMRMKSFESNGITTHHYMHMTFSVKQVGNMAKHECIHNVHCTLHCQQIFPRIQWRNGNCSIHWRRIQNFKNWIFIHVH